MKKTPIDECQICGQLLNVVCTGHQSLPYIDGRCYDHICQICYEFPCFWREIKDDWKHYTNSQQELYTVDEMVKDGFDKKEVAISLKAIKKAIKHTK
jgi:hypothetical protein